MQTIRVKAKPDTVVKDPTTGRTIPNDVFIDVIETPAIRRSIDVWQDLEVEGKASAPDAPAEAKPKK